MKDFNWILVFLFLFQFYGNVKSADLPCQDWTPYKDEKCYKIIDDSFKTYDDAEKMCASLDESSTLPIVHSSEEQSFLTNFLFKTHKKLVTFWIGAKFSSGKFHWVDNSELDFTNWGVQGPRNKSNYCIQMQSDEAEAGKWIDEPCEKPNAFVCQKLQSWSNSRLQKTLLDSRKEFRDALKEQKHQLGEANKKIAVQAQKLELSDKKILEQKQLLEFSNKNFTDLKQNLIPIGFIYTQLPKDKAPNEIWPWMTWTDVSSAYDGVFFRVIGGDAAPFGQVQEDNAPRLTKVAAVYPSEGNSGETDLSKNSWTRNLWIGNTNPPINSGNYYFTMKFFTSGGEVRPRNMAIRIWKITY